MLHFLAQILKPTIRHSLNVVCASVHVWYLTIHSISAILILMSNFIPRSLINKVTQNYHDNFLSPTGDKCILGMPITGVHTWAPNVRLNAKFTEKVFHLHISALCYIFPGTQPQHKSQHSCIWGGGKKTLKITYQ